MGVVLPRLNRTDARGLLIAARPRRRLGWIEKLKPGCSSESRVFAIRFAVLLRSVGDLVLQVAGLMIAAELAQRRLVQLKQNLAQLVGFGIAGCETLSVNLRNVRMRVFPCLPLISPSLLRWGLSRPALLMLLSIVPTADSILPQGRDGN